MMRIRWFLWVKIAEMLVLNFPDNHDARLIKRSGWNLKQIAIEPQLLSFNKINAVFLLVGIALFQVVVKHYGMEIIYSIYL